MVITAAHLLELAIRLNARSGVLTTEGVKDVERGDLRSGAVKITQATTLTSISAEIVALLKATQGE